MITDKTVKPRLHCRHVQKVSSGHIIPQKIADLIFDAKDVAHSEFEPSGQTVIWKF